MISQADEQKILDQYAVLLDAARERLESARSEFANLESIVNGLRKRMASQAPGGGAAVPSATPPAPSSVAGVGASVRHGLPTLTSVIRQVMADGVARNADAILTEIERRGDETAAQGTRQQIANRLVELKKQRYLEPVMGRRGFYKLASAEADQNDAGREGPNLPDQPGVRSPLARR